MPQMAPMNWLFLMIIFYTNFMIFISLNYFCFLYTPKLILFKKNKFSFNWKW